QPEVERPDRVLAGPRGEILQLAQEHVALHRLFLNGIVAPIRLRRGPRRRCPFGVAQPPTHWLSVMLRLRILVPGPARRARASRPGLRERALAGARRGAVRTAPSRARRFATDRRARRSAR